MSILQKNDKITRSIREVQIKKLTLLNVQKDSKQDIRSRILTLLRNQKEEDRLKKSEDVSNKLFLLPELKSAKTILFYSSFDGEVETSEMMGQAQKLQKTIALPIIIKDQKEIIPRLIEDLANELETGPYGIKQPKEDSTKPLEIAELDLVIVPGVAFDKKNHRLGRGQGYYDRFLSRLPSHIPTIGLAFDFQIVDSLPDQEHDIPVQQIVSN